MHRGYEHGLNRKLSWELFLRIPPRLPPFLRVPLHHVTTLVCFACMPGERAAARRNLRRVTGAAGLANLRLAYRLFYNFSRFLVTYGEMRRRPQAIESRVSGAEEAGSTLEALLAQGRGVLLATMHVGQWDLGLRLLSRFEVPVHVVMRREAAPDVSRYADELRAWDRLRVHELGAPALAVTLLAALGRGEIVAIQLDRPFGAGVMRVPFFGEEADLPTGPIQLALAANAPLLPMFVLLDSGARYRLLTLPPMRFERRGPEPLGEGMTRLVEVMESVVARYPDQWFNFYDVWPRGRNVA
jgi:lauroyl/myristoyl acyltransferase